MEAELIKKCLNEDRRAQQEFYKYCYGKLIGTAYRYAKDKEQAVFYLNLGFVKILLNLKQYKEEVVFIYWAKRVLINTILNELKKEKRERDRYVLTEDYSTVKISQVDELFESDMQTRLDLIKEKSLKLPPMTKNVFNLYAIDGYMHHEIAEQLGISENTSMWHYSEAKKKIKAMLEIK